ncbi:GntR family transcriptional regulator [Clostridium estertheticum]|uniref:FadR/GntR family transcriptional regulator n=1 Tax=Clostridium estertheticum TaxID=238834 RepID=UPI001C0DB20B|nr:GntR family transcriptional regulator [Clostridium estertheticum]MBU3214671.1 GntR family transcriptional regulator [Clostridium estertheticum]WAG57084.1 GntR family transcriptional regulator [Clostridium estertheticum]
MELFFEELQTPSLRELFVKQMEGMILSGKMAIGTKLPTERELSEKMKVSRAIVNGGITDMEAKGFLEVIPRTGTYVSNYKNKGKVEVLNSIMQYNGDDFDIEMLQSFMQFRKDMENTNTMKAALNRSEEDLEVIESHLIKMENTDDIAELAELAFKFHHSVSIASGNIIYPLMYNSFYPIVYALNKKYFILTGKDGKQQCLAIMRKIFESIRNKNALEAREAIMDEIDTSGKALGFRLTE